jgi:lipoprotein-releasing system permease protein
MYKLLLCWRYLRTRYIALASIISVMLGVATLIVTNAVMGGFSHALKDQLHGILSDIVLESRSLDGVPNAEWHMEEIRRVAGEYVAGMSPTVQVPAMLGYTVRDQYITQQVMLVGVDESTYGDVGDFGKYLQHPANRERLDFQLKQGGYDTINHQEVGSPKAVTRPAMEYAGWPWRRFKARETPVVVAPKGSLDADPFQTANKQAGTNGAAASPGEAAADEGTRFDPAAEQHTGCVLGVGLCSQVSSDRVMNFFALPGDDVEITYPSASKPPKPLSAKFTVVDLYESKMSEYDSEFVFVPIRKLQELRGMIDPDSKVGNFNWIQIRLKPGADLDKVRDKLREHFPIDKYVVNTWRDKKGAIISAIKFETLLLNVLLFLIIAVAGFGILATFFMIVVEKTHDIGILKSLGASSPGIMGIFLCYGVSLGIVGSFTGMLLGLVIVHYINEIADFIGWIRGQELIDPSVYNFPEIPTTVDPLSVTFVVFGAMTIAIFASILPALRAALLHPVEALRYE